MGPRPEGGLSYIAQACDGECYEVLERPARLSELMSRGYERDNDMNFEVARSEPASG